MSVEDAIHEFVRAHGDARGALPGGDRQGSVRQSARATATGSAETVAKLLEGLGFAVERHKVPGRAGQGERHGLGDQSDRATQVRAGRSDHRAQRARRRRAAGRLVGHAIPTAPKSSTAGWYGRGAAVSKSDIATYAFAILALEKCGAALNGAVELHVTYDEEAGGEIGPRYILEQGLSKPDLAIGAGFSYAVVNAHNGCLHLEVEVLGRSAHAARPFTGVDALEAANAILAALYGWRGGLAARVSEVPGIGSPQMTVGLISGGINTNVVPDRITFRLDRRMVPEENPAEVEAELRAVIAGAAKLHPEARVAVKRILLAEPLTPTRGWGETHRDALPPCEPRSRASRSGPPACRSTRTPATTPKPACRLCSTAPGPHTIEEANAHRADERLPLADLYKATEVIALTLAELMDG